MRPKKALAALIQGLALLGMTILSPSSGALAAEGKPGGTMRLLAIAAAGTIDPHINYTLQYWQLYQILYDGLVTFKKAGDRPASRSSPDLAEGLPQVDDDGKTYVFKLRKGIKFSDGRTSPSRMWSLRSSASSRSAARPPAPSTTASSAPMSA